MIFLLIYGRFHSTPKFLINFARCSIHTTRTDSRCFIVETVGERLLKLKERDYGLRHKQFSSPETNQIRQGQAQLHYSQLLNKNNITNGSDSYNGRDTEEI